MADFEWKPDLEKNPPRIVCAANRVERTGLIVCGARHCDNVMHAQLTAAGMNRERCEQGFIDQYGRFLTREEAWEIAEKQGQIIDLDRDWSKGVLFSEDLY